MIATARLALVSGFRVAFVATTATAALAGWALVGEPNMLIVRHETVSPPDWEGPTLRVALISDLHVGSPWNGLDSLRSLVARTNAENPDLVLLLGDFDINEIMGGAKVDEPLWTPILGELNATLGTYAVLGNHDWWNDHEDIRQHLEANGIPVLENRSLRLSKDNVAFWLSGIGDSVTRHDNVKRTLRGIDPDASVLALTHAPDLFDGLDPRVDLLVAGHTHGGQVHLPFVGAPAYDEPFVYGAYSLGNQRLHVTSGVGMSLYPVRFGVPPEVVMLTVKAETNSGALIAPSR